MTQSLHVGVDVGGTFTKAVAVAPQTRAVIAQLCIPTTHGAADGVARGVVDALTQLLAHPDVGAAHISLVAHSTTQAVNALLEGDAATVGVIGMGKGRDVAEAERRTRVGDMPLAGGRKLHMRYAFLDTTAGLTDAGAARAVDALAAQGAQAIAVSEAFSVDDPANELRVLSAAAARGLPSVGGHQLTSAYGLQVRTLTAAINASLSPKMLNTAELVSRSLRDAAVAAPLMVMRGDGGLTDLDTLRRKPILTLFSGPSASLAGALLSGHVMDGIFVEVGGTSSNIGIVRGGQPVMNYVRVMQYPTCVRSLDVRVIGVAGGSLARVRKRRIADVGPRSAHIAGLPYAGLSDDLPDPSELRAELCAPCAGDPADYVVLRANDGRRWAITLTCAANALGLMQAGAYGRGSQDMALRAFGALGRLLGCSPEVAARYVLDVAAQRVAEVVDAIAKEYSLRRHALQLIGGGGGAHVLVPAVAARLRLPHTIAEFAPVISSVGDALASVREEVERAMGETTSVDTVTSAARQAAIRAGATPHSVQVIVERDEKRQTLRAIATGNVALAASATHEIDEAQARHLAAQAAGDKPDALALSALTEFFWVFQTPKRWLRRAQIIVVDRGGVIRLHEHGAGLSQGTREELLAALKKQAEDTTNVLGDARAWLIAGAQLIDLAAGERGMIALAQAVLDAEAGKPAALILR